MFWFRGVVVFLLVVALLRFMGRGLRFQSRPYDTAVQVLIGSAAAELIFDVNIPLWRAFTALGTLALMHTLISYLSMWRPLKKLLVGGPSVLIENGNILRANMILHQISMEELAGALREKGFFNLADVEFALLEASGKLSVIPRSQVRPVTPRDLSLPTPYEGLPTRLIVDGTVDPHNLTKIGLDEPWLRQELHQRGIPGPSDVLYASIDTQGQLFIVHKDDIPVFPAILKGTRAHTPPGHPPMVDHDGQNHERV